MPPLSGRFRQKAGQVSSTRLQAALNRDIHLLFTPAISSVHTASLPDCRTKCTGRGYKRELREDKPGKYCNIKPRTSTSMKRVTKPAVSHALCIITFRMSGSAHCDRITRPIFRRVSSVETLEVICGEDNKPQTQRVNATR